MVCSQGPPDVWWLTNGTFRRPGPRPMKALFKRPNGRWICSYRRQIPETFSCSCFEEHKTWRPCSQVMDYILALVTNVERSGYSRFSTERGSYLDTRGLIVFRGTSGAEHAAGPCLSKSDRINERLKETTKSEFSAHKVMTQLAPLDPQGRRDQCR